jgi:two-component system CheB/CheR fusion protein
MHTWTDFERDAAGNPVRMIGTCQDVTERKIAEEELLQADRRKDEFLAMLSHELRNPLAPILNAIEVIERAGPGDEPVRSAFQAVIARQVQHMKRLLDDLLDVSRVSQGKIDLRKQRVDLAGLLLQAVEVSRPIMLEKHQQLAMTLAQEPMPLEADPTRIVQVFANLINNAAKFTDMSGHISLTTRVRDGHALVSVRDDGVGMSADLIPRAFDLFVQEHRSSDRAQGGLGIGLTLVRTLVKMHGGSVTAVSDGPGRGSEFVVRLPLAGPVVVEAGRVAPAPPADGIPLRVLVVDDNVDAADALQYVLKLGGHRVRVAHDGPGAIAAAAAEPPELVLLDIGLPGMDGYQVAERLRLAGHDRAALVAISGYGQEEDLRRSRGAGFDHHLVKPVDGAVLRKLIADLSSRFARAARD